MNLDQWLFNNFSYNVSNSSYIRRKCYIVRQIYNTLKIIHTSNRYVGNLTPYNIYIDESDNVYNIYPNDVAKKINAISSERSVNDSVSGENSVNDSVSGVSIYSLQRVDIFDFGAVIYFLFNEFKHLFTRDEDSEFFKASKLCIISDIEEDSLNSLINHMIFNTPDINKLYYLHPIFWKHEDTLKFISKVLNFDTLNNKEEIFKLDNVKVDYDDKREYWNSCFESQKSIWEFFTEYRVRYT